MLLCGCLGARSVPVRESVKADYVQNERIATEATNTVTTATGILASHTDSTRTGITTIVWYPPDSTGRQYVQSLTTSEAMAWHYSNSTLHNEEARADIITKQQSTDTGLATDARVKSKATSRLPIVKLAVIAIVAVAAWLIVRYWKYLRMLI